MKFEIITTKGVLYDKCENMEELYDDYYFPLLVEFKELEKQNAELKEDCKNHFQDAEELNKRLTEVIDERNELLEENERLKNNWNELKKWLKEENYKDEDVWIINAKDVLSKMQELEEKEEE